MKMIEEMEFEELRDRGQQDKMRAMPPRDFTYDYDGNTGERVRAIYFATYSGDVLSQAIERRLRQLGYASIIVTHNGQHFYVRKDE